MFPRIGPLSLSSAHSLAWDMEYKNPPPGPVTVTGGPREDWRTKGTALVERYLACVADPTPSLSLQCDTSRARGPLKAHRLLIKLIAEESAHIGRALKTLGFTFTELIEAAVAVAVFEQNPVPADKADSPCGRRGSPIALTDRLPPSVDRRRHVVSCRATTPFRIDYAPLVPLAGKARLLAAMRQQQAHYAWRLANPCLPHLLAELAPSRVATGRGRGRGGIGDPGDLDQGGRDAPCEQAGERDAHTAADVWDKNVLQEFMDEVVRQMSFVME
ncbi:hypothetical protein GSI_08322 [Ganoderma sinense ZZ0214-1]|uniref:Uncharacterized protein n=1 Tax=Ganoderma sinense ZZ0214-1 TaxID=1077348 RepID=A0A2G8S6Z8_9APHY|nr:hypothetical protein GSI_08322 [Ganoderma sinense ZZ0214-1]